MRLRLELFVTDVEVSVAFYTRVLGFEAARRTPDYVSLHRGAVVFGFGPVAKLPETGDRRGFNRQRLAADKSAGMEIVLELDDLNPVHELYRTCQACDVVVEPLQHRPWGLQDFRITDPDGYCLRVTHGDAAASAAGAAVPG
jgi:lactoylglutathione lyase